MLDSYQGLKPWAIFKKKTPLAKLCKSSLKTRTQFFSPLFVYFYTFFFHFCTFLKLFFWLFLHFQPVSSLSIFLLFRLLVGWKFSSVWNFLPVKPDYKKRFRMHFIPPFRLPFFFFFSKISICSFPNSLGYRSHYPKQRKENGENEKSMQHVRFL